MSVETLAPSGAVGAATDDKTDPASVTTAESTTTSKVESNDVTPYGSNVNVSKHPVLAHKVSVLRSSSTASSGFRSTLREITFHLGYEATSSLTTSPIDISVPTTDHKKHVDSKGHKVAETVALIPIMRSGLGMVDSMLELVSGAQVHHIGMYRSSRNLMPVQYYNRLPKECKNDVAYVLDACIATSATVISVVGILKKWGAPKIHVVSVIASKKGLTDLLKAHPDVYVTLGAVDEELDESGNVVPGLGDAGDRLFGTPILEDYDEELLHPSKRKRTMSVSEE